MALLGKERVVFEAVMLRVDAQSVDARVESQEEKVKFVPTMAETRTSTPMSFGSVVGQML